MKKISENYIEEIKNSYHKGLAITIISKKLKVDTSTVCKYLDIFFPDRIKYKKRARNSKYSLNEDYFREINSEDKAYFLGFLYADGNVSIKKNTVKLCLKKEDLEILKKLNKYLNSSRPLIYQKPKKIKNTDYLSSGDYTLHIDSPKIKNDLINLGCIPRKSLILKFPTKEQVPEEFQRHFIRGYFDGDGCITNLNNNSLCGIQILSTENFLKSLKDILKNSLSIESSIKNHKRIYCLSFWKRLNVLDFGEFLYKDSEIFLQRKQERFNKWKIYHHGRGREKKSNNNKGNDS